MEIANVEMAEAWNGAEGEHWSEHADRYERVGHRHWQRFLQSVPLAGTDHVLDVGCGSGGSSRDVARIASSGSVLGVDLSSPMLELARRRAQDEGLVNLRFEQGDAQVHPLDPAAFDLAISRFGVMFFSDPVAAFANIGRALRPGARLAVMAWRELAHNEWLRALRGALAAGRALPEPPPRTPGMFGLADPDHVGSVLGEAGFFGIELEEVAEPVNAGSDADDAFAFLGTLGIVKGLTEDLDDQTRAGALDSLYALVQSHETDQGVLIDSSAWLITATRP